MVSRLKYNWTLLLLFCLSAPALATDLPELSLVLDAVEQVNIKRVAKVRDIGVLQLQFGPDVDAGLGDGDFLVEDIDGDPFGGTYEVNTRGAVAFFPDDSIIDFIAVKVAETVAEVHDTFDPNSITILEVLKEKYIFRGAKRVNFLTILRASIELTLDGEVVATLVDIKLKGRGLLPTPDDGGGPTVDGSGWLVSGRVKGSFRTEITGSPFPVPKITTRINDRYNDVDVEFGPIPADNLPEQAFEVKSEGSTTFSGMFEIDPKRKRITFAVDPNGIGDQVEAMIKENLVLPAGVPIDISAFSIDVTVTDVEASGKFNPGKQLQYAIKFSYEAAIGSPGFSLIFSGTLTYTAKGKPAP
jgi:hypothetical protein